MRALRLAAVLLAGAAAGCNDDETAAGGAAATELCVSSDCGEKIALVDIPSAENIAFAGDGRLFVSGGLAVYEITRDGSGAFQATAITTETHGFTGLAIRGNILYASTGDGFLFAGELTATPRLVPIYAFDAMCLPNGTALGADGNLYVVDEPLDLCVPEPKIVRLTVDPANPLNILGQETWVAGSATGGLFLGLDNVLRFPNGLQSQGNRFYGTDGGSVYYVDLLPDGSAGEVTPIFFEPTAHDDLGVAGNQLLVTDFFTGRIFLLSQDGELLQETARAVFTSPSSVRLGQPPLFEPGDVVVTETGVLGDNDLPLDRLSVFRRRAGS